MNIIEILKKTYLPTHNKKKKKEKKKNIGSVRTLNFKQTSITNTMLLENPQNHHRVCLVQSVRVHLIAGQQKSRN